MKRKYVNTLILFLLALQAFPQTYGNEWISYSQKYYRIPIVKDGIYRIDSITLANAGVPLASINPKTIQIFARGKEQYIYIRGEADGVFNYNDTIEFYGQKNDAFLDSTLYGTAQNQSNPYVSLFNDTAMYYLTWNHSTTNKRMVLASDTSFTSYSPSPFMFKEDIRADLYDYFQGTTDVNNITDPEYLPSESIVCTSFGYGGNFSTNNWTANMNTANAYAAGPAAALTVRVVTRSNDFNLSPDYHIRIQYPSGTYDTLVDGYQSFLMHTAIPPGSLTASCPVTIYSINPGGSVSSGDCAAGYLKVRYPHTPDLEGLTEFKMYVPAHGSPAATYFNLTNFNVLGGSMRFYDLTYHRRLTVVPAGPNFNVLIRDSLGAEKFCYVTSDNQIIRVNSITAVNGNGLFTNYQSFATDSAYVIISHPALFQGANAYKLYRSSFQGGSNHVVLANIMELYDQFSYGVRQHPLSIRRFCDYLVHTYPTKPKYLFLIGKSFDEPGIRFAGYYNQSLVPTMGYPASDNLFTIKLGTNSYSPTLATGRLSANTNSDVMLYLNKVTAYEQNQPAPWMKQVLHFGGGATSGEQSVFRGYLQNYKAIIEGDTLFGGHVTSFYKTSTAPIQINQSDSLRQMIDAGVSIMTFFGHASGSGFDQSIDDPSTYNNSPRNPLVIANSCYAGNIHSTGSTSEKFIINSRGAIGFIASTYLGLSGELNNYSTGLYNSIARLNYAKGVGKHIQYTVKNRESLPNFDLYAKTTVLAMTLHGDPALVVTSPHLPDYAIADPDVFFDTHSQPDSVTVFTVVHNNGKAVRDSFFVRVFRKFPDGETDAYLKFLHSPAYCDTFRFKIPVDFNRGIGINRISVVVDYTNRIQEITKSNNATGDVNLVISGSAILPVWPYNDAIIPTDTVTLKASTANALEPPRNYVFQIDTTDQYNSPMKRTVTLINKPGGVITWKPPLTFTDSTVYFWRVSPDSTSPANSFRWKESSFQYITNTKGWGQAHFFQFKNDGFQYVKFNRPVRRFDFVNDVKSIEINNGVMNFTNINWPDINYKMNGTTMEESSCIIPGFTLAVLDPISLKPTVIDTPCSANITLPYTAPDGNTVCVCNTILNAYDFSDSSVTTRSRLQNFINSIPNGRYVLGWTNSATGMPHNIPYYPASLVTAFKSLGCSNSMGNVPGGLAYAFLGRKGWIPGQAREAFGATANQKIQVLDTLSTNWNSGYVSSEVIGPAQSWTALHWRQRHLESPSYDSIAIRVTGFNSSGTPVVLANFPKDSIDVLDLGHYVNASLYPYIQLTAYMKDDTNRTPPQIRRWQVMYTPQPEMAVNPPLNFSFKKDTVQEGQTLTMSCAIQNISTWNFTDSLLITYWILDKNRVRHNLPSKVRKPPFNAGTWFADTVSVSTAGYPGLNSLWMEANPIGKPRSQYEQYHFNNVVQKQFLASTDRINPLMDVTFDGVHILNGDIVSAKPNITVSLKDENLYLALNDTGDFKLFIQYPNSSQAQRVYFGSQLSFVPAVLPNNSCRLLYTPTLTLDGTYTLIVQAKDRSNNSSGAVDYQISFDVINKAMITNVMNYPNPFTTATHFVFTVTGSEVPTMFRIQIMTITGKLVREIEREELGPIHIGRNITEYAWDGRDQFGDRLANGVYFYRVLTKINSENIEHMDSGADQYIKHDFGKMYLMK